MVKQNFLQIVIAVCLLGASASSARAATAADAEQIFHLSKVQGGLVVQIGCGDGKLTAALRPNSRFVVQGLDTDAANVQKARAYIRSLGLYGPVSVDRFDGRHLPYAENLVNLLVADGLGAVPMAEVLRVLRPLGVACIRKDGRWNTTVKPWPPDIDQWTHYLHSADGNPVARDRVVGPPKHYQWIAGPLWLRSHETDSSVRTLVTARGRLFYIADEAPISLTGDHDLPDKWFLIARDAFNGVPLWKVPIADWGWRAWKLSWFSARPGDLPLNIQKRLVAVGDEVYLTLGYHAPVSQIDAATGRVLKTYQQTARTGEILYQDGVLVLTVLEPDGVRLMAVDADSGRQLWTSPRSYCGTTTDYYRFRTAYGSVPAPNVDPTLNTATDGKVVALLDGEDVVGVDFRSGNERWRTPFPLVKADYTAGRINAQRTVWVGTLIVRDGVVLHASPNQLAALSADSGKILWTKPKKFLQHLWFEWKDVFVIDGLVWTWSAELERGRLEGAPEGRRGSSTWPVSVNGYDLHSGQLRRSVALGNIFKTYHHHRCYRDKATVRYILASRRGTEFVDLEQGRHSVHNWVRGTCHVGMMPANGLQYAPPHPCVCYLDEKLSGFNALAPACSADQRRARQREARPLERGPAYGKTTGAAAGPDDWPTYRHDPLRSGSTEARVLADLDVLWQTPLAGKLGPPVAVGQRLFVPLVDQHALVAVRASDGRQLWQFSTGGRVDSPPTYYGGALLFGSADGWVYCVRAADGQLVWRFRAAPAERRIGAFGQLESAWPVHGSVLVLDGTAYFAAGRSSHLDGGIYLYGLDAATGQLRAEARLEGPSFDAQKISQNYQLPMGALADILQSDGELIFMRSLTFDRRLKQQKPASKRASRRVHAQGGFLDDCYFKRTPWSFGPKNNYARLIVHDSQVAYFVRMFDTLRGLDPSVYFTPGKRGYLLFAQAAGSRPRQKDKPRWSVWVPIRVRAMAATPGVLFVAGPPDVVDPADPLGAFEGRKGGLVRAVSAADGKTLGERKLGSPPVFNGVAAAQGRLLLSLADGSLICFGSR